MSKPSDELWQFLGCLFLLMFLFYAGLIVVAGIVLYIVFG